MPTPSFPSPVERLLQQAIGHHRRGRHHQAERLYRALLRVHPRHPDAHHNLGLLLLREQPARALPHLQTALEVNPGVERYWLSHVEALLLAQRPEEAHRVLTLGRERGLGGEELESLASHLPLSPPGPTPKEQERLSTLFAQGHYDQVASRAREMTRRWPDHGFGWKALGGVLHRTGRPAEALPPMERAVALMPGDAGAHCILGVLLSDLGRKEEAEASYRQSLALDPDLADTHTNLGALHNTRGRYRESETALRRAIALQPDHLEAHNNLGNTLLRQGRLDEAETLLGSTLQLLRQLWVDQPDRQPFAAPAVMDPGAAHLALRDARSQLLGANLPFFLSHGTLLGLMRQGELLPNDKDLDIGMPWEVDRHRLLTVMQEGGWHEHLRNQFPLDDTQRQYHIALYHQPTGVAMDVWFHQADGDHLLSGFHWHPHPVQSRPRRFTIGTLEWSGWAWPIPSPPEQYLTDYYGPDWRTPDPGFDSLLSNPCATPVSRPIRRLFGYQHLIRALRQGEWPKALSLCHQLLAVQADDPRIRELIPWIRDQGEGVERAPEGGA